MSASVARIRPSNLVLSSGRHRIAAYTIFPSTINAPRRRYLSQTGKKDDSRLELADGRRKDIGKTLADEYASIKSHYGKVHPETGRPSGMPSS